MLTTRFWGEPTEPFSWPSPYLVVQKEWVDTTRPDDQWRHRTAVGDARAHVLVPIRVPLFLARLNQRLTARRLRRA